MNQKTLIIIAVVVILTLIAAPKLRTLPGVSKLPTI